jgi:malonate-semialdehyde dehydrogenase (acetylating)/methylmalonate-semialdehyde dehydrogenase
MNSLTTVLDRPVRNYVGSAWREVDGADGQPIENPATGEHLATTPFTGEVGLGQAVALAENAFESWRETPIEERIQPVFRLKQLLDEHEEDIARVLVAEHGKTLSEARGELRRGIENVEVACGMPTLMQAGTLQHAAPDIDESAIRHPVGVFAAVTPFNFPGMIPLWFLPYAVASGNSFVLKPSERTPLTALAIFELVDEAGFPDGVVNLVNGGPGTVNAILAHEGIVGVSFVGSTPVARHVYETAAKHGKRVQAQGGAKYHIVVSDSAHLPFAAEQTVSSSFANSGQRCLANPVAVVHDAVYDEFADLVVAEARAMRVGDGLDPETEMGPLVTAEHAGRVREYIETGVEEGATLLLDGRERGEGSFLAPTVFGDVTLEMTSPARRSSGRSSRSFARRASRRPFRWRTPAARQRREPLHRAGPGSPTVPHRNRGRQRRRERGDGRTDGVLPLRRVQGLVLR